ncbi:MAG TPA: symmetrical bis(5'-nucleosyl)-tetraphosphatase [Candidatus Dormibacteraeota bacterium]|nr:symmetrical bis(5'-nucleosyl)-tetraphosphatase [Candidatus Dormibacteraeota bacterium]
MATYAISDAQGCAATLDRLLTILPLRADDRFWFVGDLVNRGPASAAVLRTVRGLGDRAVVVLGNHDLHLLARAAGMVAAKKRDTLDDVLAAPDRDELCAWLRARPILHREGNYILVHGGLPPAWTPAAAQRLATAAATALAGPHGPTIAAAGARFPARPPEELDGNARHAAVIATLTLLRTLRADGTPDWAFKGAPAQAPRGNVPWFEARGRRNGDVTIVFGHWSALGLHLADRVIGIDTGCVWGDRLTAIRLEDRRVFQVPCADIVASARDRD